MQKLMQGRFYSASSLKFEKERVRVSEFDNALETRRYADARILPLRRTRFSGGNVYEGGVADRDSNFLAGYFRRRDSTKVNNTCVASYAVGSGVERSKEEAIFLGIHNKHFGHFLTDGLSRLHSLGAAPSSARLAYIYVPTKKRVFYPEILKLLEVSADRLLFVDKPTEFRTVYVPDQSLYFFESFHRDFLKPYNVILSNLASRSSLKKIYLSRSRLAAPDCVNERYFENFYASRGFEIVHPQELSFERQVAIVHGAEYIVSTVGTLTHLAVFAKPGTRLVGLLRASDFVPRVQHSIDKLRELNSTYVDVSCNFLPAHRAFPSLYIGPNENWRKFVKDEYAVSIKQNIFDYINKGDSDFGLYLESWLQGYLKGEKIKYIEGQSPRDLMDAMRMAERSHFKRAE